MEAQAERLRAIIKTQSEIAAADLDSGEVMRLVAQRAQELTSATAGVIEVPDRDEMVYTVTTGDATPYLGIRLDRDSSLSGLALDLDQVLHCNDNEVDPRIDRTASRRVKARSMIAVPLRHDGEAVGVLKVYSSDPDAFLPEDVETLQLLTESISAQMAHASLFEVKEKESRTDALTGLLNRRAYEERFGHRGRQECSLQAPPGARPLRPQRLQGRQRRARPPRRDGVLKGVAAAIDSSRLTDDAFRIGGDEFALLMPDTAVDGGEDCGVGESSRRSRMRSSATERLQRASGRFAVQWRRTRVARRRRSGAPRGKAPLAGKKPDRAQVRSLNSFGDRLPGPQRRLQETRFEETEEPELEPGQVLLGIDSFGLTTNNITYG